MPPSLQTVRPEMIRKTLDGDDQTLGACVIAWLLLSTDNDLRYAATKLPTFLSDIENILARSKHANHICMMSGREFDAICHSTYNLIKTILED